MRGFGPDSFAQAMAAPLSRVWAVVNVAGPFYGHSVEVRDRWLVRALPNVCAVRRVPSRPQLAAE